MARLLRLAALAAVLSLAALVAGCGEKQAAYHFADTEGPYLQAGPLKYQIQLSREINPRQPYDEQILHGLPAKEAKVRKGEVLFGIWLRAENPTHLPALTAPNFDIVDTLGNRYEPLTYPPGVNSMIYHPVSLRGGGLLPTPGTIQSQGGPRGQIIVFKFRVNVYQNRPLIMSIHPVTGREARVELDL